jgi:outer membrane protein assembly factor BamB
MPQSWIPTGCVKELVILVLVLGVSATDEAQPLETSNSDTASKSFSANWPSFRGPNALGHAAHANPPMKWNAADGTGVRWKISLPKHGMSSPVAWGDRIFLTGADEDSRQLYCLDADSGTLLWQHDVTGVPGSPDDGKIPEVLEETGYAAPTPVTNGKYVAAIFATGELVCVNSEGERIWIKHLGIPRNHYGHASSLQCHQNLLFVQYDQKENGQLLAFDLSSGKRAWLAERGAMSWSSPILAEHNGRVELILTDNQGVEGYDPTSGRSLWRVECLDGEIASSAAYANGTVFVANEGAPACAIDISNPERKISWQWDEALPDAVSPVANDKFLVVPTAFGVVSCLDVKSGESLWEHEFDRGFSSSPVLVADRIYIIDESGTTQIFKMGAEFELLGTADIGEPVYATPALVNDRIYVRSLAHLFCIQAETNK